MQKIDIRRPVADVRRESYPDVGDQLDALVALATFLRDQGAELPPKVSAWIERCEAVKQQNPHRK